MNQALFDGLVENECRRIKSTLGTKGLEYGREDRLHNFKRAAALAAETPIKSARGMLAKHIVSVWDMVDDAEAGNLPAESFIEEKIGDAINYLILMRALFFEATRGRVGENPPVATMIERTVTKKKNGGKRK